MGAGSETCCLGVFAGAASVRVCGALALPGSATAAAVEGCWAEWECRADWAAPWSRGEPSGCFIGNERNACRTCERKEVPCGRERGLHGWEFRRRFDTHQRLCSALSEAHRAFWPGVNDVKVGPFMHEAEEVLQQRLDSPAPLRGLHKQILHASACHGLVLQSLLVAPARLETQQVKQICISIHHASNTWCSLNCAPRVCGHRPLAVTGSHVATTCP